MDVSRVPGLFLDLQALDANIAAMGGWCAAHDVELAPHIKTTMTPAIVERQLQAGAWGVTVATVEQAQLATTWGARRIIIANEVVTPSALRDLAMLATGENAPECLLFADSVHGVELAAQAMASPAADTGALGVLIDVGTPGGRTGVRSPAAATELAAMVVTEAGLSLRGIAAYEGVRPNQRDAENVRAIDAHCDAALQLLEQLRPLIVAEPPIFTMGGSAFPDRVALALARHRSDGAEQFTTVVRSGCYVTHDHGTYASVSTIDGLHPALTVRAAVISTPEPGMVILGAGKRELPYDAGLPVLLQAWDETGRHREDVGGTPSRMFDHHLVITDAHGLQVGDIVSLGISHPCSAFDRWRSLHVLDTDGNAIDEWPIRFHCD